MLTYLTEKYFYDKKLGKNRLVIENENGHIILEDDIQKVSTTPTYLPYKLCDEKEFIGKKYIAIEFEQNIWDDVYWEVKWEEKEHYLNRMRGIQNG